MEFEKERLMMSEEEVRKRGRELLNEDPAILITKYMFLEQKIQKQKEVIDKATNELFILKDMIYKPETREENFEIQRKISSIIKRLNGKEVE